MTSNPSYEVRSSQPTDTIPHGKHHHPFKVWAHKPVFDEDRLPWKCVASFYFLNECLEYISDRQAEGCDVVFQSPAHTSVVRHTDRNVVSGRHETLPEECTSLEYTP